MLLFFFSLLVKRLEQFEVLDDVPRTDFSRGIYSLPSLNNETTLLATAIKIRAELDKDLAHTRTLAQDGKFSRDNDHDSKRSTNSSNNVHHHGGDYSNSGVDSHSFRSPASSHSGVAYTPQHSPMSTSSVIVAPSNQSRTNMANIGGASGSPGSGKIKKATRIKTGTHGLSQSSDKQKPGGRGHSSRKRKPDADPNAPKKPSNAFFWFCQEMRSSLQEQCRVEGLSGQHDLTKALARLWSETKTEDKKVRCSYVSSALCTYVCVIPSPSIISFPSLQVLSYRVDSHVHAV